MDAIEAIEYKGFTIEIRPEEHLFDSPREWDNLGTMTCWHRSYYLGDVERPGESADHWDWMREVNAIFLPLYLYDHSGVTMRTYPFSCPWDSGWVGHIHIERNRVREEFNWKRITKDRLARIESILRCEVKTYDQYLTGDVYCYRTRDPDGKIVDSCSGFYGHDWEENNLVPSAKSEIDCFAAERLKQEVNLTRRLAEATTLEDL